MRKFILRWLTRLFVVVGICLPAIRLNYGEAALLKQEIGAARPYGGTMRLHAASEVLWGNFYPAWGTTYQNQVRELRFVAEDPEGKLESEFRIPAEARERVLFWASIYSRFSQRMKVIHDRDNPAIVYGYLDFTPLFRDLKPAAAARRAIQIERLVMQKLGQAILQTGTSRSDVLTEKDQAELKKLLVDRGASFRPRWELLVGLRAQTGQRDVFQQALERSQLLLPHIESVFASHGLPRGLARIPFVESSFDNAARSRMGAVGIWQFIPRTSREMIHRRDRKQWTDPFRQTTAAARLLKRYRRALPDWGTAVTSYNSGIGRISKLLRANQGKAFSDLVGGASEKGLGFAGRNYHAEFLAANLVESYKTQLFSPGIIPANLASLRAELAFYPGGACWAPKPVAKPGRRSVMNEISTAEFTDSSRELGRLDSPDLIRRIRSVYRRDLGRARR